jgi:hypothetical protein
MHAQRATYHVVPASDGHGWRLVEEGRLCWLHRFKTREDAVSFGHHLAQSWEVDRLVAHSAQGEPEVVWVFAEDPDRVCLMES